MIKHAARLATVASLTLVAGLAMARPELATPPQSDIKLPTVPAAVPAPELNPSTVLAAVTLLVGGLLVVRGRKARG